MKEFAKYVVVSLVGCVILMIMLDFVYTKLLNNNKNFSKVSWVQNSYGKHYDYLVVGSSRALNDVNVPMIDSVTGLTGLNTAQYDVHPFEIFLYMKSYFENNNTANTLLVQVDHTYNDESHSHIATPDFMPYIFSHDYYKYYDSLNDKGTSFYKFPFIRYLIYGSKIGIRQIFEVNFKEIESPWKNRSGFCPNVNNVNHTDSVFFKPKMDKSSNIWMTKLQKLAKEYNTHLVFFTSPYYHIEFDLVRDFFRNKFENYYDFSSSLNDPIYYFDNKHLNERGADKFTFEFVNEMIDRGDLVMKK